MFEVEIRNDQDLLTKQFPESVITKSGNKARLDTQRVIITDRSDKIAVGVTVSATVRHFCETEKGFSMTEESQTFGEYEFVPSESTLKDIVNTINKLVDNITDTIVAWG